MGGSQEDAPYDPQGFLGSMVPKELFASEEYWDTPDAGAWLAGFRLFMEVVKGVTEGTAPTRPEEILVAWAHAYWDNIRPVLLRHAFARRARIV